MGCSFTSFDKIIHLTKKLPEDKLKEACNLIAFYSLVSLLDFCVANECFTKEQSTVLHSFIMMWEHLDSDYCEEDYEKTLELYDAIGVTQEVYQKYLKEEEE